MEVLVQTVKDMQSTQEEEHRRNLALQRDNERLRCALRERSSKRQWHVFDVVERHYKQLEHHRQRMQTGSTGDIPEGDDLSEYDIEEQDGHDSVSVFSSRNTSPLRQASFKHSLGSCSTGLAPSLPRLALGNH